MTQTVWIVRHGNRLDFVNKEWFKTAKRPYDSPLSPDGILQAQALAQRLKGEEISHIFSSPFLRTVQTAQYLAEMLELSLKIESGFSEWLNPERFPAMPEVLSIQELVKQFPRIDLSYTSCISAQYPESWDEALERAGKTARCITAKLTDNILIVGHGASVLGATMGLVGGSHEFHCAPCSVIKLVRQGQEWILELKGDTSHLSQNEKLIRFNFLLQALLKPRGI